MGMTITEKILAKASNNELVSPGEIHNINIDLVMMTDVMFPLVLEVLKDIGCDEVYDRNKAVLVMDHYIPSPNINASNQNIYSREGAKKYGIKCLENQGVCHILLPDRGYVAPGEVIIGSDSHTTTYGALGAFSTGLGVTDIAAALVTGYLWMKIPETIKIVLNGKPNKKIMGKDIILRLLSILGVEGGRYKALEITGDSLKYLGIDDRISISNMAVECGAKNCVFSYDKIMEEFLNGRLDRKYRYVKSDKAARYCRIINIDCNDLKPQVAFPSSPDNVKDVRESAGIKIDQIYIGSCTNGRISDLRKAAKILRGKKVNNEVRLIITPGSQDVYLEALKEGLIEIFIEAGAFVNGPSCGACFGGHFGIIGDNEVCLSTTNRNFIGRMGSKKGKIYLCSPLTAAASALKGEISEYEENENGI